MEEKRKQIQSYLHNTINPIIQPMLELLAKERPEQPLKWMQTYIHKLINEEGSQTVGQSSEQEEDQVEFMKKMERLKKKGTKKMSRQGISAEVFGKFNQKSEFKPRIVNKDPTTCLLLKTLLQKSILFTNLTQQDLSIIVQSTQQINASVGQKIITQGQQGDCLFIVFSGQYDCFKIIGGKNTYLKTYTTGQAFGQLALMYNAPRAASITCKTEGKIFALDRQTFKNIVQEAATKKRKNYSQILSKVQILSQVDAYQREQLCDSLKEQSYDANEYIVRQGESGDRFYMVAQGKLIAEKTQKGASQAKTVFQYDAGDYFGEIALIQNTVRQASIKTTTSCKIVWIDRDTFKRQLGPIEDILSRNMEKYKKYLGQ